MSYLTVGTKIKAHHLSRSALIYIRLSTLTQVQRSTGSIAQQYGLKDRAVELGWLPENVVEIDQDLGRSGTSTVGRDGFILLLSEVGLGRCGAVFCSKVDRLGRPIFDLPQLFKLCYVNNTLIIDEDGIYDLSDYNDRLILGIKNTFGEAETHLIRTRSQACRLIKAKNGELRFELPIGFLFNHKGKIILDPDEQVQNAVRLVFQEFERCGVARRVVKFFTENDLTFPKRVTNSIGFSELVWGRLKYPRVLNILRHPVYAGAYAYGRYKSESQTQPFSGKTSGTKRIIVKPEEWQVLLLKNHEGYLSWETYLLNQKIIKQNTTNGSDISRSTPKSGSALLQGNYIVCGRCGSRLRIIYPKSNAQPVYTCEREMHDYGGGRCQWIAAGVVDAAIENLFFQAIQPAQFEISLSVLEQVEEQNRKAIEQFERQIEGARYEADRSQRYFKQVEPENRLVARSLERDWNEKLEEVRLLERKRASMPEQLFQTLDPAKRQSILALAQDLPRLWKLPTTSQEERKQLLRLLFKEIFLEKVKSIVHIRIRWQTRACTSHMINYLTFPDSHRTDPGVLDLIRDLAPKHTDRQIAEILNQKGITSRHGRCYTKDNVRGIRERGGIPGGCPEYLTQKDTRGDGRYNVRAAARILNIDPCTVVKWCREKRLDASQSKARCPWWINLPLAKIEELRKPNKKYYRSARERGLSTHN